MREPSIRTTPLGSVESTSGKLRRPQRLSGTRALIYDAQAKAGTGTTLDSDVRLIGDYSARLDAPAAAGSTPGTTGTEVNEVITPPGGTVDLTANYLVVWLRIAASRDEAASVHDLVRVQVSDNAFSSRVGQLYVAHPSNEQVGNRRDVWFPVIVPPYNSAYLPASGYNPYYYRPSSGPTITDWAAINSIRILARSRVNQLGQSAVLPVYVGKIESVPLPDNWTVSIRCDRTERETVNNVTRILAKYGWPCTFAAIPGRMIEDASYITLAEAAALHDSLGHEFSVYDYPNVAYSGAYDGVNNFGGGSSTVPGVAWSTRSMASVKADLARARAALEDVGLTGSLDILNGQARKIYDPDGYAEIIEPYFNALSVPNAWEAPTYHASENPMRYPERMFFRSQDAATSLARIKQSIDRAHAQKETFRLLVHSVEDTGPSDTTLGMTATEFETLIDYIAAKAGATPVVTESQIRDGLA